MTQKLETKNSGNAVAIPQRHGGTLRPFQPGQSGNPAGKPKGTKHLSSWIQKLTEDNEFTVDNFLHSGKVFKGAPIEAIIGVAIRQAIDGERDWAEWLAKYGWGSMKQIEHSGITPTTFIVTRGPIQDEEGVND